MSFQRSLIFNLKTFGLCSGALVLAGLQSSYASTPRIEILGATGGEAATTNLSTHDGTTCLSGTVYRKTAWTSPHVHIALVDKNGKAFASKSVTLTGWQGKPATNPRGTYTAFFPSGEMARAATVQVTFQNGLHTFCETGKPSTCAKG